jgi:hypothetical protein
MKPTQIDGQKPFLTVSFTLSPAITLSECSTKYILAPSVDHDEKISQNIARRWKKLSTWVS